MTGRARVRLAPGTMNRLERDWAQELEARRRMGYVQWYAYEPVKLRLGDRCFYMPDFLVLRDDGSLVFYEVKGHWEDDARVKIKAAASRYPLFAFVAVQRGKKNGPRWECEEIKAVHAEGV